MTKLDAEALDLVDRYLFAVRKSLPPDLGADVTLELRTLIEDKLEERTGADRRPDVGDVIGLLREMDAGREALRLRGARDGAHRLVGDPRSRTTERGTDSTHQWAAQLSRALPEPRRRKAVRDRRPPPW